MIAPVAKSRGAGIANASSAIRGLVRSGGGKTQKQSPTTCAVRRNFALARRHRADESSGSRTRRTVASELLLVPSGSGPQPEPSKHGARRSALSRERRRLVCATRRRCRRSINAALSAEARVLAGSRANNRPAVSRCAAFSALQTGRRSSAPAASEPRRALDRGMWIVLRCDWRWLRRRPGHLGWRDADAHNAPISVTLVGDPAGTGICSSPPFNLSDRLLTSHQLRILPRGATCSM